MYYNKAKINEHDNNKSSKGQSTNKINNENFL